MQEIFMIVKNNDLKALAQVKDDLSFLVDQTKLTEAFEEVNKTAEKVAHSCKALQGIVNELFTRNLEDWRPKIKEDLPVEPDVEQPVDQAEQ
jgi:hypothetical protein